MYYSKIFSLLFLLTFCWSISAQNNQIQKANKLYKINEYSQAISFYEKGLQEEKSLSAKTNLAYCYKMTNKLSTAEKLYSEIVIEKRARPITKYYYGETLMSNGKYAEARNWFLEYAEITPNDERALKMAKACEKVGAIKPMFENIELNSFSQNSKSDDSGAIFYKNGIVFSSDRKSGINPLKKKTGWTGRDYVKIYYCAADSTGAYQKPKDFSSKLNELNKHCGPISINKDQNYVVYTKTGVNPGKNDTYNMQLFYSQLNRKSKWKRPRTLAFCDENKNYMHPALSADGKTLYFVSDKPGGEGGTDIYKVRMTEKGWSVPLNLGDVVNTSFNEGFPFLGPEGRLYFSSKGHAGFGGFDIFYVEEESKGLWSEPRNIGTPVNSSNDDISFHVNSDFTKCVFSSSREGDNDNIYMFDITSSTIINTDFEEPAETYVRQPLGPTKTNNHDIVKGNEETETAYLKSDIENTENLDAIDTPDEYANNGGRLREGFNEIEDTDEAENFEDAITARGVDSNIEKTKAVKIEEAENFIDDSDVPANEKITDEAAISIAKAENLDGPLKNTKSNKDTIPQTDTETDIEATETQTQDVQKVNSDPTTQTEVGEVEEIEEAVGFNDDSVVPANETKAEGAEMVIAETENINDTPAEAETESQDEQKVNNTLNTQSKPNDLSTVPDINDGRPEPSVYPFVQMKYLLKRGNDVRGKTFRINGIDFEKGQYIITPEITLRLNLLVDVLEKYPNLSIEIGAYSNSIGDDAENLEVTKARAGAIAAHLINQGISTDRINADGYGETQLLNHCSNGVKCNEKEQNINERVEIYVF